MDLGLTGKRFAVTGGTRGIGRAVVEGLIAEGAQVAFCARTSEEVAQAQQELGSAASGTAVDVGATATLATWVNSTAEAFGGLDGVVANVSALGIPESPENWRTTFEVDLMGTVGLVDAALPYLEASGAGSIVTISSVSGREIDFAAGPYGTMKAAIIHYTQGLAFRLAGKGVRANTVSPVTPTFRAVCGRPSKRTTPSCSPRPSRSTPPAGWLLRRRWPTRWCSCPVRQRVSSPGRTCWSTGR